MIIRLTLVAHAATVALRSAAFPDDEPIDERGAAKAALLGRSLGRATEALTSPALGARQTAEALGLNAQTESALRDCNYGAWAGHAFDEIARDSPAAVAAWTSDPAVAPPGGESMIEVCRRIGRWLDGFRTPGHTVAVTHAAVIRTAILHAIGAPPSAFWRVDIVPLSLTDLRRSGDRWTLRAAGCLTHRGEEEDTA